LSGKARNTVQGGQRLRRRRRGLGVAVAAFLITGVILGCSVEKHYRILSFFFDGVPDPALIAASRSELEAVRAAGGTIYTHEPYGQAQCASCHRGPRGRMKTEVTSELCLDCHAGVDDEHRYMHGPVVVKACLWCHAPHEATVKPLLRASGNTLCRQCHTAASSPASVHPAHADPDRACLDCHSGHGGPDRYFLHATYNDSFPNARSQEPEFGSPESGGPDAFALTPDP
jgi:predicted CXXCH cytochrome family protein